jgi:ABC-type transporter Mla subunit MlaD
MRAASEMGGGGGGMVMDGNDPALPRLIQALEGSAREIDVTFARAGSQLGEGLSLFEGLKERLSTLSAELSGETIADAGRTLSGLAGELRAINDGLHDETGVLQELAAHSKDASQALDRLLEHMRLITILARSARIEAVSVQAAGRDFGDFTSEIVALTTQAQRTIQNCARDHDHLSALLGTALAAQRDFEGRYGHALSALAGNLDQTLAEVAQRQQRSVSLTSDAALHSGKIAMAAGGAIIALQSGDSIRQRLEHAIKALRLLGAVAVGEGPGAELDAQERGAAALVLRRLQAAQLDESALTLSQDADAIESALALLAGDTAGLLDLVRSLYQGDGGKSGSFLADLEADLAQAADLLAKCDRARSGVDRVTDALSTVLETCQETVAALADTVSSIVLIGMNAGLRAARIGTGGRSLVVIAQELKFAADQVASDAAALTPTFAQMQQTSSGLKSGGRLDAAHFSALDDAMRDSLAAMRRTGDRLGMTLGQLSREGGGFGEVVARARLSFSNAGAMSDLIASGAVELTRSVAGREMPERGGVADRVRGLIDAHVWPNYTMVGERTIHQAVVGLLLPDEAGAAAPAVVVQTADDLDDILF